MKDEPKIPRVMLEKGSVSQGVKLTFATFWKTHCGKFLMCTTNCFGCGKDGHNVTDFPTISARGMEGKKVPPSVPRDDTPKRNLLHALRDKGSKTGDEDVGNL